MSERGGVWLRETNRDGGDGRSKGGADTWKCHVCKQSGHLAYNCPSKKTQEESVSTMKEGEFKKGMKNVKCMESQGLDYSFLKGCLDEQGFTSLPQYDSLSIITWACMLTKIIKYY